MEHSISDINQPDIDPASENQENARQLIERISLSTKVKNMGEEMRDRTLFEIHNRINKAARHTFRIRVAMVAASVVFLLGISNYFSYQQGFQQSSQLVEMVNPLGLRSSIELPDGTKVVLNAGTVLKYPSIFVGQREVELIGEAFFDVAPDAKHSFVVKTEDLNVRVYGTSFNVKSYREDKDVEVILVEGSVGIEINGREVHRMMPEEQTVFNKHNKEIVKRLVNVEHCTAWKDGKYYFRQTSLEDIVKQLERTFNVHIVIESDKLKKTTFSGDFVRGENLEQILRVMTSDKRTFYQIKENIVYIRE